MAFTLKPKTLAIIGALGLAAVVVVWTSATDFSNHHKKLEAEAADWRVQGPPCPEVTRAAYDAVSDQFNYREPAQSLTFDYDDVRISRSSGKVYCNGVIYENSMMNDTYSVFQFQHPRKLSIRSDEGLHFYLTGENPVTLSFPHGKPVCVLAAHLDKVGSKN